MTKDAFAAFEPELVRTGEASYYTASKGKGDAVLLLHGFPQTHLCWRDVAPGLARSHRVVVADLRGYGASEAPAGGPRGEGYSKREVASELAEVMSKLGHETFAVVGHDRGARVAFRMALEHPDRVRATVVLNVIPTVDQFERMGDASLGYWPWFLLAQPAPFPERILAADPAGFLDYIFDTWPSVPAAIGPDARSAYLKAMTPSTIAAMCADYRASFHLDRVHDSEDRAAERRIRGPLLALAGAEESQLADDGEVWSRWATDLRVGTVAGGHFIPEEAPKELLRRILPFLS